MKKYLTFPFNLSAIWIFCILVVNPIGDFPLNDDWSYARNAQSLALENKIYFDDWGAMTLIAHSIWGAFFCKIFGFSFTVLRFSTLVLGWIGLLMFYLFFQEGGMSKKQAFGASMLMGFLPFYFVHSFSYMTEVPFMCCLMIAAYFSIKTINDQGDKFIIWSTVFSIIATLIRQPGILVPLAFLVTYLAKNSFSSKTILKGISPSFFTLGSLIIFTRWRNANYGLSHNFGKTSQLLDNITNGQLEHAITMRAPGFFILWGLFLLPLLTAMIPYFWKKVSLFGQILSITITLIISYFLIDSLAEFHLGNTFINLGVGPIVLPSEGHPPISSLHPNDWKNLNLIGFIGGMLLFNWILIRTIQVLLLWKNKTSNTVNWNTFFGLATAFGYFIFLMLNNFYFDRYCLVAFPFLILMLFPVSNNLSIPQPLKIISLTFLGIIIFFSIGATHDYLSWNRARWEIVNYAHQELHLSPKEINGGFEYKKSFDIKFDRPLGYQGVEKWDDPREKFIISHTELCLFNTVKSFPYQRYFPPKLDSIFLVQKGKFSQMDTIICGAELLTTDSLQFMTNHSEIRLSNIESRVEDKVHSGQHSILLDSNHPYGFTFVLKDLQPCEKILVSAWKFSSFNAVKAVIKTRDGFHLPSPHFIEAKDETGWIKQVQEFTISEDLNIKEATFFLFNPTPEKVYFDDLMIVRIR